MHFDAHQMLSSKMKLNAISFFKLKFIYKFHENSIKLQDFLEKSLMKTLRK